MKLLDLFPPCLRPECDQYGTAHKHVMPYQEEFINAPEKYLLMLGGYGSGKTVPGCVLGVTLSLAIQGNRGIVVRRSYPKLHDSTERIFLETLQRADCGFKSYEVRDGWPHRIVLENGSEVSFRETKDLGRFLGPEYGWFYIDEAVEEPENTFTDLTGRLRLNQARKFLKGFLTSNPPNSPPYAPHWLERLWGRDPGRREVTMPSGKVTFRLWRVSTRANPFLPKSYVDSLLVTHTPSEVRRIIDGDYGFSFKGRAVYTPPFQFAYHVGLPPTHPMALARVWDFGFRQPAVTWHQFIVCQARALHWHILHEYLPSNIESEPLAADVLRITKERFPEIPELMIADGGDTAGAQFNERGPGPIIRLARPRNQGGFGLRFKHQKFPDVNPGLDYVRGQLRRKCECGQYLVCVHRGCVATIDAFAGGYHYADIPVDRAMPQSAEKPIKDGYYDNVMDTVRYAGLLFHQPASRSPNFWRELTAEPGTADNGANDPMAWMNY